MDEYGRYYNFCLNSDDMNAIEGYLFQPHDYADDPEDRSSVSCFVKRNHLSVRRIERDESGLVKIVGVCTTSHNEKYEFIRYYSYNRKCLFMMILDSLIDGKFWCIRLDDARDHLDLEDDRNVEMVIQLILRVCF